MDCSWGLSLFVLFERSLVNSMFDSCSWGLSLFVLFEPGHLTKDVELCSWGLSLFVLFEHTTTQMEHTKVLED